MNTTLEITYKLSSTGVADMTEKTGTKIFTNANTLVIHSLVDISKQIDELMNEALASYAKYTGYKYPDKPKKVK